MRVALVGLLTILLPQVAQAEASVPWYHYHKDLLILSFWSAKAGAHVIRWQAINSRGRVKGAAHRERVKLIRGSNTIKFKVGRAGAHRVSFQIGKRKVEVWANRGVWAAGPQGTQVERVRRGIRMPAHFAGLSDIQLSRGFRAKVTADSPLPLSVERSFGYPKGAGLRPPRGRTLVLVARGNVGPVQVTLGQQLGKRRMYYDYPLVLDGTFRRYNIPFSAFRSRTPKAKRLVALHSAAITTLRPVNKGDQITIGFFGVGRPGPKIRRVTYDATQTKVQIQGKRRGMVVRTVSRRGQQMSIRETPATKGLVKVAQGGETRAWMCYRYSSAVEVCDPPDAPHTTYAGTPAAHDEFLVDDFIADAHVNAHRMPFLPFASDPVSRDAQSFARKQGRLIWKFKLADAKNYVGFHSDLPSTLPKSMHAVRVSLKTKVKPELIDVELTNAKGRRAKVNLGQYTNDLTKQQTVSIPRAAFDASYRASGQRGSLGRLARLSMVVAPTLDPVSGRIEIQSIKFSAARGRLPIALFDGRRPQQTSISGPISKEGGGGATVRLNWGISGKQGKGLGIAVSNLSAKAYGLVSFGVGGIDIGKYQTLHFWARQQGNPAKVSVAISDGRKRAKVWLSGFAKVGAEWTEVRIPLAKFVAKGLRRKKIKQLLFVWDGGDVLQHRLQLDNIALVP